MIKSSSSLLFLSDLCNCDILLRCLSLMLSHPPNELQTNRKVEKKHRLDMIGPFAQVAFIVAVCQASTCHSNPCSASHRSVFRMRRLASSAVSSNRVRVPGTTLSSCAGGAGGSLGHIFPKACHGTWDNKESNPGSDPQPQHETW